MRRGYQVAVMDWKSRAVLSWRLSNTLESGFCVEAFPAALRRARKEPEGAQYRPGAASLRGKHGLGPWKRPAGVAVSMDGKGRGMDNVFIERLWRAVEQAHN